jgi:hypothetical protein
MKTSNSVKFSPHRSKQRAPGTQPNQSKGQWMDWAQVENGKWEKANGK